MNRRNNRASKSDNKLMNVLGDFYATIINGEDIRTEEDKILDHIRTAHEEWRNAEKYFQDATDPDLIDYAIYRLQAAKTRYTYLMKIAKQRGLKGSLH